MSEGGDDLIRWAASTVERARLPLALAGAASSAMMLRYASVEFNPIKLDYLAWASAAAVALASLGELLAYKKKYGYASTLTLPIVSLGLALFGRSASFALSMWISGLASPVIGGSIAGEASVGLVLMVFPASLICLFTAVVHAALRRPITFAPSPPYEESFRALGQKAARLWVYALRHPVAVSFAVGFAVRLVPELLWWPWLVGWDTVEYAAHLEDFLAEPRLFSAYYWMGRMRNMPPMIDWALSVPALLFGSWSVYKLYPPVAYGLVCALSALISRRVLRMGSGWSILTGAVSALFILNLRISWDYQRQTLGTIFLMAFLAYSGSGSIPGSSSALSGTAAGKGSTAVGWKRAAASSALLICSALSHEVTAFASAVALLYLTVHSAQRRSIAGSSAYAASLACTAALLFWYWGAPAYESRYLGTLPAGFVANLSERGQVVSYLVAGFGALLPLALLSLRRVNGAYASAVLGLVAAGISPIVASYTSVTTWYRFLIGAAPLAVPLAMKTLSGSERKGAAAMVVLLLVAPGVAFTMPNGGIYTATLVGAIREFPAAMTPSPASATAQEGLLEDAPAALALVAGGEPLFAYAEHARFLHLFARNPSPGELVWVSSVNGWAVNSTMNRLGVDRILLFSSSSQEEVERSVNSFTYVGEMLSFNVTRVWKGEGGFSVYEICKNKIYF